MHGIRLLCRNGDDLLIMGCQHPYPGATQLASPPAGGTQTGYKRVLSFYSSSCSERIYTQYTYYTATGYTCPSGGTLSGATCVQNPPYSCPNGGTPDTVVVCGATTYTGTCSYAATATTTYSCPASWTLTGTTCYQGGTCPSGGSINYNINASTTDVCLYAPLCFAGGSLFNSNWQCQVSHTCSAGSLNQTSDKCEYAGAGNTTYSCPSGGSLSGTTCDTTSTYNATATTTYSCPSGGSLSGTTCTVTSTSAYTATDTYTYSCQSGWSGPLWNPLGQGGVLCYQLATCQYPLTLQGSVCGETPACPSSTTPNWTLGVCEESASSLCASQYSMGYNSTYDKCSSAVPCPSVATSAGNTVPTAVNGITERCEISASLFCGAGTTYGNATNRCEAAPLADCLGSYDQGTGKCKLALACPPTGAIPQNANSPLCQANPILQCPSGSSPGPISGSTVTCQSTPVCATGAFSGQIGACVVYGNGLCPGDYAYDRTSDNCRANPVCANSTFDPSQDKCCSCASSNACLSADTGATYQCSPNACVDLAANPPTGALTDLAYYRNDGTVTPAGQCSGMTYIFGGKPGQCRLAGQQTLWNNCCNPASQWGVDSCDPNTDIMTVADRNAGLCHLLDDQGGVYCVESWPIAGCVQRAEVYCCFKSKLARILHEQGRRQLTSFGGTNGWGYVMFPNCRGFTPDEFQKLDITKVDFSEVIADMNGRIEGLLPGLQNNATNAVQRYYNQTK